MPSPPSREHKALLGLGAAGLALGAGAWAVQRRAGRRIAADPERLVLERDVEGRPMAVRTADGTRLHAEVFGPDGAPTIVLVHGWTCALRFWQYQLLDLQRDLRVVAYDQRGHGRSEAPVDRDYSIEAFASDLDAVLAACVPAGERAVIAGHSLGAMAIVAWAGRANGRLGDRVAAAALVNTGVGDLISETLIVRMPNGRARRALGAALLSAPAPLPSRPANLLDGALRQIAMSRSASPAQVAFCTEMVLECNPNTRAGCGASLSRLDLRDAVTELDVPTLVIGGERDRLTPPIHSERLAEALPQPIGFELIEAVGHMAPIEAHEEVSDRLRALTLDALGPAADPTGQPASTAR
jgi:pimeloyl-ACP methyl ester carboxylesterase